VLAVRFVCIQVFIPYEVGVPGLKRVLILLFSLLPAALVLVSCGYNASGTGTTGSGLKYRVFISNQVSAGTGTAGVYILNAQIDEKPNIGAISAGNAPGMMVLTPTKGQTLVFSSLGTQFSDNQLTFINNASESASGHLTLPGFTESIIVSPDSSTAYAAVPTAAVIGQSPGAVKVMGLSSASFAGEVDIPAIHYLSINNGGSRILGFTDVLSTLGAPCVQTPSYLFVITPTLVGNQPCPAVPLPGINFPFDHPVAAFFSGDDTTAYVINCGPECGGVQSSVQKLEMTPSQCLPDGACQPVPVTAASEALMVGSTMYLAGSYANAVLPQQPCPGQTAFTPTCGSLTIFDLGSMTATTSGIAITDGFHNRIGFGPNGQLFVGARTCTQNPGVSGCLSIYNTLSTAVGPVAPGGVLIPPAPGDVTGIEPIGKRSVVYVVQGGSLWIYDTLTDGLQIIQNNPNNPGQVFALVGDFNDVKLVDF